MDEANDPLIERSKQRVGHTLKDKWRLDELIGVGGMAAVYSATHCKNGKRVAVKMLHAELSVGSGEIRGRFLREGRTANTVDHPGAPQVMDEDEDDDGSVFLVMELLDGETLAHRFERKARSLVIEEVLLVCDQVLDVLAAAHEKHIVHRDIKPDNIFLTRSGGVKLLDFGIARLRELSTDTSATRSGATMGTPAYMAPEQARARWDEVDARTDIWAVGATMFKLLTGRVVHVADTVNEQLLAAMTQPAPPIGSLAPTVPIPVVEVVDKALAFNIEDRWKDARSMQKAIREAYRAVAGDAPASVRLSFDDDGNLARADTVAASSKSPTSMTAAHDSAAFGPPKRPRRRSRLGLLLVLGALGAAGYFVATRGKVELAKSLQIEADGGVLGTAVANIPSAIARIEQAIPSSVPPTAESALPGRTEGPGPLGTSARNDPSLADPAAAAAATTVAPPAPAPADSTESAEITHAPEPTVTPTPSAPSVTAASSPASQPRAAAPEPKAAPKKAPPPPPKKHTHHRRRP